MSLRSFPRLKELSMIYFPGLFLGPRHLPGLLLARDRKFRKDFSNFPFFLGGSLIPFADYAGGGGGGGVCFGGRLLWWGGVWAHILGGFMGSFYLWVAFYSRKVDIFWGWGRGFIASPDRVVATRQNTIPPGDSGPFVDRARRRSLSHPTGNPRWKLAKFFFWPMRL